MSLWMVRAGRTGEDESTAFEKNLAIIGFIEVEDLSKTQTKDDILQLVKKANPDGSESKNGNLTAQLYAFVHKIKVGDLIVLPMKGKPHVAIGKVKANYHYQEINGSTRHTREVEWLRTDVLKTSIGQDLLYSLGAFMTVCQIERNNAEERFKEILAGKPDPDITTAGGNTGPGNISNIPPDVEQVINDQLMSHLERNFKGHKLEALVNEILKAEGFTTDLVKPGPDGGVDILAGKGDLGFGNPKIGVQVKSSASPVDVTVFRNLQGVLHSFGAELGLLVSWGGFNSAVEKEARQSFFKIRLWDADDILEAIQRNYDRFPEELQKELPLKRMWVLVAGDD